MAAETPVRRISFDDDDVETQNGDAYHGQINKQTSSLNQLATKPTSAQTGSAGQIAVMPSEKSLNNNDSIQRIMHPLVN